MQISVEVLRATRAADALFVRMNQGDRPILAALVWTVDEVDGLVHDVADCPTSHWPRSCAPCPIAPRSTARPSLLGTTSTTGRSTGSKTGTAASPSEPRDRSWFRFRPRATFEDPFVDAARSLLLIDTMGWPAAVRAYRDPVGYVAPNLDLSARFHRLETGSEWLYAETVMHRSPPTASLGVQ